jgi:DNA-binding transcriptional ArsR family regulator
VRGRLGDLDLLPLLSLLPVRGYNPDFVTPPPRSPLDSFEDELARVRGTPPAQVLKELEIFERQHGGFPAAAEPLRRNPRRELPKLARTMATYWTRAVEPFWPRILALLSADLRYRATRLTEGGPAALFAELNPRVTFERDWVHVDHAWEGTVELAGQGLLLLPSAFSWQHVFTIALEPWQPSLVYPARGVALLWAPEREAAPELAGLMGGTRARILAAVDAPASTTELAERLGVTPGGVSQHLSALAGARLVARTREGRTVLYARTPLGDSLVAGA